MPKVFVSIGSNIDKERNVRSALRALQDRYGPLSLSSVYESEAVGFNGENFFNLVAVFDSDEPVERINATLSEIERAHGRQRGGERFASRTLDLDLLLYGNLVRHDSVIELPRGEITEHAFVLRPLAELAPDMPHPESGVPFARLWREFPADGERIWPVPFSVAN